MRRDGVLSAEGLLLPGIIESLGKENEASVAKVAWISRKDNGKAYGSMIVYLHSGSHANRLLQEGYFHVNGESGFTNIFERRPRPDQCYNCHGMNHKAYNCKKAAICARCVTEGHNHHNCNRWRYIGALDRQQAQQMWRATRWCMRPELRFWSPSANL